MKVPRHLRIIRCNVCDKVFTMDAVDQSSYELQLRGMDYCPVSGHPVLLSMLEATTDMTEEVDR